ncbi:uncharacterized protein LOC116304243 [Actinia tenebrosa]|uniref:Uncharacterized protein LOC116304243 n=1 Tax=Actinia tenebrosa TaxID=6105 RepID=A0A6P8IUF6_ACTTE|nr:uncharacterized protein LOC116304243 [Actinia tenebrosa]
MRFFIRNKTKYDPSVAFTDPVITVNVDHTQEITKIKEEARKVGKACKITALYVAIQDGSFVDLADDRTINYYNLQDNTILETTSNPFWVTTLYSNMRRREQEAASNPEDARLCFQAQKSYIRRCMAIGLLLNGTGETEKQPATFHALEDLYEYCLNQGKKPAYMSQFTLEELQEMFEAYQEEHQNHRDPIGSFIYSQAMKLGYLRDNNTIDSNDPFRSHFEQSGEQQRDVPARRNGGQNRNARAGGRRRANRNRTCDDCEVAIAISYCADCNPPLCLCDTCWRSLHRGATRKNHQMKDISEAPTPTTYTPQAYRAPFAMLVAFHR